VKTLYITDLDGTFLNDSAEVSEESKSIINSLSKDGLLFSVATARSLLSARELLNGIEFNAPVVLSSGVFVYDMKKQKTVNCFYIEDGAFKEILKVFENADKSPFVFFFNNGTEEYDLQFTSLKLPIHREYYETRRKSMGSIIHKVDKICPVSGFSPVFISLCDEYSDLLPITKRLDGIDGVGYSFYSDTYTPYWFLEVFNKEATKLKGLEIVREYVKAEKVISFGDNRNDIPLFMGADEKYAVANAVDELKALATDVIASNNENSVARFIKEDFNA